MIKVSPTQLQSYSDYLQEHIDQQELIGRVSKTLPETEAMTKGKLFHQAVETGVSEYFQDAFSNSVISCIKEWIMIHEYKHYATLDVDGIQVKLRGIADGVSGSFIHEIKTTSRPINFDILNKYRNSVQAMCYQVIFEKDVKFHIVQLKNGDKIYTYQGNDDADTMEYEFLEVIDYSTIDCDMNIIQSKNTITNLARGFIEWCKHNNLQEFITEVVE